MTRALVGYDLFASKTIPRLSPRNERDVRTEAAGRTRLVDHDIAFGLRRRVNVRSRVVFEYHLVGVALQQTRQRNRVVVLLPDQVLRHLGYEATALRDLAIKRRARQIQ